MTIRGFSFHPSQGITKKIKNKEYPIQQQNLKENNFQGTPPISLSNLTNNDVYIPRDNSQPETTTSQTMKLTDKCQQNLKKFHKSTYNNFNILKTLISPTMNHMPTSINDYRNYFLNPEALTLLADNQNIPSALSAELQKIINDHQTCLPSKFLLAANAIITKEDSNSANTLWNNCKKYQAYQIITGSLLDYYLKWSISQNNPENFANSQDPKEGIKNFLANYHDFATNLKIRSVKPDQKAQLDDLLIFRIPPTQLESAEKTALLQAPQVEFSDDPEDPVSNQLDFNEIPFDLKYTLENRLNLAQILNPNVRIR